MKYNLLDLLLDCCAVQKKKKHQNEEDYENRKSPVGTGWPIYRLEVIIIKNHNDDTADKHALVAGIGRYSRKVHKRMGKGKLHKSSKIKSFVKVLNYNHLMPTRYSVDLALEQKVTPKRSNRPKRTIQISAN